MVASLATLEGQDVAIRQAALLVLQRHIKTHWDRTLDSFEEPAVPHEARPQLKQGLLNLIGHEERLVRRAAIYCITTIANLDWPEEWPDLFDQLVPALQSESPALVHGALHVLAELSALVDVRHLPTLAPLLLPPLHHIATSTAYGPRTRSTAVSSVTNFMTGLSDYTKQEGDRALYSAHVKPRLQPWTSLLGELAFSEATPWCLKAEAITSITTMLAAFSKPLASLLPMTTDLVLKLLVSLSSTYEAAVIFSSEGLDEQEDEEGLSTSMEPVLRACFDFIAELTDNAKARTVLKDSLPTILALMMQYGAMTEEQRAHAFAAIDTLLESYGKVTATRALLSAITSTIEKGQAARTTSEFWWTACESACATLCRTAVSQLLIDVLGAGKVEFDLPSYLGRDIAALAQEVQFPFLAGRALLATGRLAEAVPAELLQSFLQLALSGLQPEAPIPFKASSLQAINFYATKLLTHNPDSIRPAVAAIYEGVLALLSVSTMELMRTMVETLTQVAPVNPEVTGAYASKLCSLGLAVFLKASADALMADVVGEYFSALAELPAVVPTLLAKAVPTLASLLARHDEAGLVGLIHVAMDIVAAIAKSADEEHGAQFLQQVLPVVVDSICTSSDISLVQNGVEAVRMFISRVIAHILSPEVPESACAFAGMMVTSLILRAGDALGPITEQILLATLHKLQSSRTLTVQQSLLLIFARLANENLDTVLQFLRAHHILWCRALEFVLRMWVQNHTDFYGNYDTIVSTVALSKLLMRDDADLLSCTVQGEEIHKPGIQLRSRARKNGGPQFAQVPLLERVFQLLVRQHHDETLKQAEGDDDDDDAEVEDEWEDVDEQGQLADGTFVPADEIFSTSDIVDLGFGQFEDDLDMDDDPDVKADPLSQVNLKEYLEQGFVALRDGSPAQFSQLTARLTEADQKFLTAAFQ
ncbi:uncharacterized protein MONBRDRAFT_29399 [Monosiga brevicollis MX1]|uniref:Importin N-terminal domain-containing protein n=1 Tax=Monosiga brevicollis TaxID=81824 RepID=A9VAZ4_MONBE|nr:uncharacterized protein MONBRDRAFT_29399 [Monosiga brevicollis MX1]EDQ85302.1 predicted protein [Monosiga brevicollis MX1]|eukprot:XP_001749923.1 hypothetical protein [Monosiga brevicollis MX1]